MNLIDKFIVWGENKALKRNRVKVIPSCIKDKTLLVRYKMYESKLFDINLHELLCSDNDRELHSHPVWFITLILKGSYIEHLPNGIKKVRKPFNFLLRGKNTFHKVELLDESKPVYTLNLWFAKKFDDWYFLCDNGVKIYYKKFLNRKGCN